MRRQIANPSGAVAGGGGGVAAALVTPLLLPEMHERYFYLAKVLTALAAFVDRRFIAVAAGIQIASISTYLSYLGPSSLKGAELMPLRLAALVAFLAAVAAVAILVHRLSRPGGGLQTVGGGRQNLDHVVEPVGADPEGTRRDAVAQRQA